MLKEECGGNFKYTNGVKDCSDCLKPHTKGAYEHVMSKMKMVIEIGSQRD
jgi:Zn-finger protein